MAMTPEQLPVFKAHILANTDPVVVQAVADGAHNAIAAWYNEDTNPPVSVWKTSVSVDDANDAIDWTEYMSVPVLGLPDLAGTKRAIEQGTTYARQNNALNQLLRNGDFNPSLQTIRDALGVIFSGDPNTIAALLALAKETANRVEEVFVSGPVQGAFIRAFIGDTNANEVSAALNS